MTPTRISLISLGTLAALLFLARGAWILLVACVAALDAEEDLA